MTIIIIIIVHDDVLRKTTILWLSSVGITQFTGTIITFGAINK